MQNLLRLEMRVCYADLEMEICQLFSEIEPIFLLFNLNDQRQNTIYIPYRLNSYLPSHILYYYKIN